MTGWTIFGIALLLLCAVGEFLYIIWKLETDQVAPEREVPTRVIPADWDRIMRETTLERRKSRK
jgi:hypothetical protein